MSRLRGEEDSRVASARYTRAAAQACGSQPIPLQTLRPAFFQLDVQLFFGTVRALPEVPEQSRWGLDGALSTGWMVRALKAASRRAKV